MFESAELGHEVDDDAYGKEVAKLRADLLDAQYDLLESKAFPVIILVNGVDGAGKGETVNLLNEWLDQRHIFGRRRSASVAPRPIRRRARSTTEIRRTHVALARLAHARSWACSCRRRAARLLPRARRRR